MTLATAPLPQPPASPLPGLNVMLIGPTGTGKTDSLMTLVEAGLELFVLFTEPHGRSVLTASAQRRGLSLDRVHWMYVKPSSSQDFGEIAASVKTQHNLSWKVMSGMTEDPSKSKSLGMYNMYSALHNFTCERCGKQFGDVSSWGTDRCLAFDGMSGLNEAAMHLYTGDSIAKSQPQWGAAQKQELLIINKLCYDTRAFFVLIGHVVRQENAITGGIHLVPNALGKAIAPDLPRYFNDVILSQRIVAQFNWNTAAPNADLKATTCPISDKLEPSFKPLVEEWKKRGGILEASQEKLQNA